MCCYCLAVALVRMPPVLVPLVLWGGRLWISHPWGGWTRPSTSSPLVLGRVLSGISKPLPSALQMSSSTLPRAHPTGTYVAWLLLVYLWFHTMWNCSHPWQFLLQLRHQEEGRDWACCQGQPLNGACILVHSALETFMLLAVVSVPVLPMFRVFWDLYAVLVFSAQLKLLSNVVDWEQKVPGLPNSISLVIFLYSVVCIMYAYEYWDDSAFELSALLLSPFVYQW
jgi:hypothetical protein